MQNFFKNTIATFVELQKACCLFVNLNVFSFKRGALEYEKF
ncbi:hypothetical protein BVAVS116_A0030 (plasmid) [Borreliella valaisiana VS116]|uniref:Uncharacterized protein n=1 Tax=Borreliella valaisiana VS116 TaxID=445987 RepID=C0R871_BORVA|nr:hypothetical protein BVAVS116_A0030 [Borreliella valaisiana VS116]